MNTADADTGNHLPSRITDYAGRPIGPLRLARAMKLIILSGTCILAAIGVLWPPAAVTIIFLQEQLGASKAMTGLNYTLVLLGVAASLPGAFPFSRRQRRKGLWMAITTAARCFMLLPAVVALLSSHSEWQTSLTWVFLLSLCITSTGTFFCSPAWWSWMGELIPENILGTFFGRRYRWNLGGQSIMALLAAVVLDRMRGTPYERETFFAIFLIAGILAVADPLLFIPVPEPVRPKPPLRSFKDTLGNYLVPLRDSNFFKVIIAASLYNVFYNLPQVFLIIFLRGERVDGVWIGGQATAWFLVLTSVALAGGNALGSNLWGRLADRIGHRIVWMLGSLGYVTHLAFFFINRDNYMPLAIANYFIFGLMYGGQQVAQFNLALSMAPAQRREYYMSMFLTVVVASAAVGPWVGGLLADRFRMFPSIILPSGQPACYAHLILIIALVGMVPSMWIMMRVPDARGGAFLPWVGRLVTGELLRTAWSIGILSSSPSASRRIRALRSITHRDGNVLLPDIIAALDDPERGVRREALLALGRLGTTEALDVLRWHLHEPDARIRAPSIEAIAQTESPDRIDLIKRALHDPDSRVRTAAVAAMGKMRNPDAAQALRELLADERDGEVLVSAAVALSSMKEFSAVSEMVNLALRSENKTVRMQMLVALADLLSGTTGFERLWRQDRHWRGQGFARLVHRMRKQARVLTKNTAVERLTRSERRTRIAAFDDLVEVFLEQVQAERWSSALATLPRIGFQFLRLQYHYQGDEEHALEFISAVAPLHAQRFWLVHYLRHASETGSSPDAPWDGLTLLALHVMAHGLEA